MSYKCLITCPINREALRKAKCGGPTNTGEPDAFRLVYRNRMREIISEIMRDKAAAVDHLRQWTVGKIPAADREQFARTVETELASLHEGNFVRYRVRPF